MAEHKHAEVLRAIADGETVQYKNVQGKWEDAFFAPFNPLAKEFDYMEWRVKPTTKTVTGWVNVYENRLGDLVYATKEKAHKVGGSSIIDSIYGKYINTIEISHTWEE